MNRVKVLGFCLGPRSAPEGHQPEQRMQELPRNEGASISGSRHDKDHITFRSIRQTPSLNPKT